MFERRHLFLSGLMALLALAAYWPWQPQAAEWVELLVLLAALLWVPMGFLAYQASRWPIGLWLLPGLGLGLSFWLPTSWASGLLAVPWLALSLWALLRHARLGTHDGRFFTFALLFWNVAGAWAVAHAFGWQPLGFSPIIVLLTAAHFHYAGFLLMLLLALAYRASASPSFKALGYFTIGSTLAVAVAITLTRLSGWAFGETISGTAMALAGSWAAILYWQRAAQRPPLARWCWRLGSLLLLGGMLLALSYAFRHTVAVPSLNIPNMYAWHGSGNALALALLLLGWKVPD